MFEALADLMASLPPGTAKVAGTWVAALLTLAVLSYVVGNNPAFRLAQYLFVGMAAGYAAALVWNHTLWPRLRLLVGDPASHWHYAVFFALGFLLLSRGLRSISVLGNLPLGVLFGTGAGLALGGAIGGSLIPQMSATVVSVDPAAYGLGLVGWARAIDVILLVLGTIAVLSAFHFAGKGRGFPNALGHGVFRVLGGAGRKLMMVAFGALLAGAALSFFAILKSRLDFLIHDWLSVFGNMGI